MSNTRPRRRRRSSAEQMFWDRLGVAERVAFTVGYAVGQGHPFPSPAMIADLRTQIAADRRRTTAARTDPTAPAPFRATPRPTDPDRPRRRNGYDYAEVAAIARAAIAAGRSAATDVFEMIDHCKSPGAASMAISTARKQGHDIPYVRGPRT